MPIFNCHGCPLSIFACPIGTIQNFASLRIIPISVIASLGAVGSIIGRMPCGWLCPFGLLQDLIGKTTVATKKIWKKLGLARYAVLVIFAILVPYFFTIESPVTICRLCPAGTLEAAIPWRIIEGDGWQTSSVGFIIGLTILMEVAIASYAILRAFCRYLCPLGAILSLFNSFSLYKLRIAPSCKNCEKCNKLCPIDIKVSETPNSTDCIRCLNCLKCKHVKYGI